MARLKSKNDPAFLFDLRVPLHHYGKPRRLATIRAFEAPLDEQRHRFTTGHTTLFLELTFEGRKLWAFGDTSIGIPAHESIDGPEAKAFALSLFALKPGDADEDFFADYTPEQLSFVEAWGDELTMVRMARFGEDS